MKKSRIIMGIAGFALLVGAAILWNNYNNLYIATGFLGVLFLGFAGTTEGKQVKED